MSSVNAHNKTPLVTVGKILLAAIVLLGAYWYFTNLEKKHAAIDSFDACVAAEYTVTSVYP